MKGKRGLQVLEEKGEDQAALVEKGKRTTRFWGRRRREPRCFGRVGTLWVWQELGPRALGCSLLPHGLGSKRDFAWKKRGERTLAGGP